jgi:RHS repeat-associated protein
MAVVNYTVANGEIIAETRGAVRSLYTPDPQGNTIALFDATQTKTDTWTYLPYGEVKARTGTTPTPFQYGGTLGYYRDTDNKAYVRARYLDKVKGRWLTEDPFLNTDQHGYAYVNNSPDAN